MTPLALNLFEALKRHRLRLVLAESCTGGLAAATLAAIPGVSEVLCGSMVVYQTAVKSEWLSIDAALLQSPGPVSREVTKRLAVSILETTPQASIAAAVTGHLGPVGRPHDMHDGDTAAASPPDTDSDGQLFFAVARSKPLQNPASATVCCTSAKLAAPPPGGAEDYAARHARQREATDRLFAEILRSIDEAR